MDSTLDLLEQLLSLTESFTDQMSGTERDNWQHIAARAADIREEDNAS